MLMLPDNGGGDGQHEGQEPHQDGDLLGLGGGAQVLGLHRMNYGVVSEQRNSVNYNVCSSSNNNGDIFQASFDKKLAASH